MFPKRDKNTHICSSNDLVCIVFVFKCASVIVKPLALNATIKVFTDVFPPLN